MVRFKECFPTSKISEIEGRIPAAKKFILGLLDEPAELIDDIECMSDAEIEEGLRLGGGHGLYLEPKTIKINPHMSSVAILLNYIHENIHHVLPEASENLVDHLTDLVAYQMGINR